LIGGLIAGVCGWAMTSDWFSKFINQK